MPQRIRTLLLDALLEDGSTGALAIADDGTIAERLHRNDDIDSVKRTRCEVVQLEGRLLLPSLAEPHAHLDKSLTADLAPNPTGDLRGAIDAWVVAERQGLFDHDSVVERVSRSLRMLLEAGTTYVRSHINIGGAIGIDYLRAAQEAATPFRSLMDIEFVTLSHVPMTGPGNGPNQQALDAALETGVEGIGGCPHLEPDPAACIDLVLTTAERHGRFVDLHTDETLDPTVITLELLAERSRRHSVNVTASHCVSLGMVDLESRDRIIERVSDSGVHIVALPQTNLFLQGRDYPVGTPRGLTPINALRSAGVTVAAGGDNAQDPFNLVGRNDPLETAALLVMAGHLLPNEAFGAVSNAARRLGGRPRVGTTAGDVADLIAVPASSIRQTIAEAPTDRLVLKGGRVVASTTVLRSIDMG